MGLFDTIARVGTAIVTGGTSELVRLVSPSLATSFQQLTFPTNLKQIATTTGVVLPTSQLPLGVARNLLAPASIPGYANLGSQYQAQGYVYDPKTRGFTQPIQPTTTQGAPMGFDLGGLLSSVSNIFGGNQNPVFNAVSTGANLAQNFLPQQTYGIAPQPVAARVPQVMAPALRSIPMIGRGFFNKYPNLATAIQSLRNQGRNIKRSQLYSMLKRFGPELLISGGILTAAAVSELIQAGPGRRRMNPANAKALRRAAGRIRSFHKLCTHTDLLKSRGRRVGAARCGSCKRSPCRC